MWRAPAEAVKAGKLYGKGVALEGGDTDDDEELDVDSEEDSPSTDATGISASSAATASAGEGSDQSSTGGSDSGYSTASEVVHNLNNELMESIEKKQQRIASILQHGLSEAEAGNIVPGVQERSER